MRTLVQPRVEAEVAFVLGRDIDPADEDEITIELVRDAPSRSRCRRWRSSTRGSTSWDIRFTDTVADNASSGLYVVGRDGRTLDELEPRDVEMSLTINGEVRSCRQRRRLPRRPARGAALARRPGHRFGDPLRAGHLVLSGALGPFVPFAPGDRVEASISGFEPLVADVRRVSFEE